MSAKARPINGIHVVNQKMFHNDVEVDTVSIEEAMDQFLKFLKQSG